MSLTRDAMASPASPILTGKLLTFHPGSPGGWATTAVCPGGGSRGLWPSTQAGCWASLGSPQVLTHKHGVTGRGCAVSRADSPRCTQLSAGRTLRHSASVP